MRTMVPILALLLVPMGCFPDFADIGGGDDDSTPGDDDTTPTDDDDTTPTGDDDTTPTDDDDTTPTDDDDTTPTDDDDTTPTDDDDTTPGDDDDTTPGDDDDTTPADDDDATPGDDDDTGGCVDGATTPGAGGTTWVTLCGGTFDMGAPTADEYPVHSVTVPTFEIMSTEVTVAQYGQCPMPGDCSEPTAGGACNWTVGGRQNHPTNCVTWQQATDYCTWAGGRLPSEAEWEYAATSGGQPIDYPWGNTPATCDYAVMDDATHTSGCDLGTTWPVCSKPLGNSDQELCDLSGNLYEWVQDWYHGCFACWMCMYSSGCDGSTYAPDDGTAWEFPVGTSRVEKGGNLVNDANYMRAANRGALSPTSQWYTVGFRCVR
jgi:formylglycine-generating enzyme required for sulfatase activity